MPALIAVIAATLLAGCGGGHSATRSDVIARANAICFDSQQALRSIPPPSAGSETLAPYLHKITAIVAKEATQLRALPRPAPRQAMLNRFIAASSSSVAEYRAAARAAAAGDDGGVQQAFARLRASPAAGYARAYGLKQCSGQSTPSS
jgi:hypothetical protein